MKNEIFKIKLLLSGIENNIAQYDNGADLDSCDKQFIRDAKTELMRFMENVVGDNPQDLEAWLDDELAQAQEAGNV